MSVAGVQNTANTPDGDSTEERIAAFEREYAESLALSDELTKNFQSVKDGADKELEAVQSKIIELVGIDRDEDILDDAEVELYEKLVEHERKLLIVSRAHGEMIDRLELLHEGAPVGEDEDGSEAERKDSPTGRRDKDRLIEDSSLHSNGDSVGHTGREDGVSTSGAKGGSKQSAGGNTDSRGDGGKPDSGAFV